MPSSSGCLWPWGGYTASNVLSGIVALQWLWVLLGHDHRDSIRTRLAAIVATGTCCAAFVGNYSINMDVVIIFPLVLGISIVGCLLGTLLTKPEDDAVLMDFYRRGVRGLLGPVLKKVLPRTRVSSATGFWARHFNIAVVLCGRLAWWRCLSTSSSGNFPRRLASQSSWQHRRFSIHVVRPSE